jgi:chemotaxis protein CheC
MGAPIELRALRDINQLADASAETVRAHIEQMAGVDATVDVTGLTFLAPDDLGQHLGPERTYAGSVPIESPPHGVFCVNLGAQGGAALAAQMTGTSPADGLSEMQESALTELTNILASGFLDGMADTLSTEITHGPPTIHQGTGPAVADAIIPASHDDPVLVIVNTQVALPDVTDTPVTFYLIPDADQFAALLATLS